MYLTELKLKWNSLEKIVQLKDVTTDLLVKELNTCLKTLGNRKFQYDDSANKGFKPDSPIFSPLYIDDIISFFLTRKNILNHLGIQWGRQSFSTGLYFNPINFGMMETSPNFECGESPVFLSLNQEIDLQFRITGKRNFHKNLLKLPFLVFHSFVNLDQNDLIRLEYFANMAKATLAKSKTIVVTETLNKDLVPDVRSLPIDAIFVLRKQFNNKEINPISVDVVNRLSEMIDSLLADNEDHVGNFLETGLIK